MPHTAENQSVDLNKATIGQELIVQKILDKSLALKLMEMGCMPKMQICKQNAAPFQGPVLIKVFPNGNLLALRYEEAEKVMVGAAVE